MSLSILFVVFTPDSAKSQGKTYQGTEGFNVKAQSGREAKAWSIGVMEWLSPHIPPHPTTPILQHSNSP